MPLFVSFPLCLGSSSSLSPSSFALVPSSDTVFMNILDGSDSASCNVV